MSFTLGDIIGKTQPVDPDYGRERRLHLDCPSGKVAYEKADAQELAERFNQENDDSRHRGEKMRARRCPFCNYFHIGHRRR